MKFNEIKKARLRDLEMFHRFINGGQLNNEEASDVKVFIQRRKQQRSYKREYLNLLDQVTISDGGKQRASIDDDDDQKEREKKNKRSNTKTTKTNRQTQRKHICQPSETDKANCFQVMVKSSLA